MTTTSYLFFLLCCIPITVYPLIIRNSTRELISITFAQIGEENQAYVLEPGKKIKINGSPKKAVKFTVTTMETHLEGNYIVNIKDNLTIMVDDYQLMLIGNTHEEHKERKAAPAPAEKTAE